MSRNTATCLVQLAQPSGVELNAHLVLDEKPTRQDQKLKTLSKYVQQYPTGWKKRWELADLLYAMGRWSQAVEEYCQVLERQPRLIDVRLQLGKILHLMGREAEAIAVYETALFLCRHVATRHHLGGLIAVCRRCLQKAAKEFESAASLKPDNGAHWHALGQVHLETESPVAALRAFDVVLSINPDDLVALIHSYDARLAVGQFQSARRQLSRARELAPADFRTVKRLADHRCRMRLVTGEEGKQTRQMIKAALRLAPDAADAHESLAYYHIFRGEWAKGVGVLQQFTEEHPNNPSGWYYYARCLFHTGENQAAAEGILKAYCLFPNDCEIYRTLCEILPTAGMTSPHAPLLQRKGGNATPASIVKEMLERFPERWSVWATAGRLLVESFQDIERGCRVSAKGTQLQPHLADAWFRHGRVLALAGKHREAVEVLEKGWQLLPKEGGYLQSVPAAVWLGESYRVLGDDAASQRRWEEASQRAKELMEFDQATAHYWQGRALSGLGEWLGAMEAYRTALSQQLLYPARGEVQSALKQLPTMVRKGSPP